MKKMGKKKPVKAIPRPRVRNELFVLKWYWEVFTNFFSGGLRRLCSELWRTRSLTWSSWSSLGWTCWPWPWTTTARTRCGSLPWRTSTWASSASSQPNASWRSSLFGFITSKNHGIFLILLLLFYPFLVSIYYIFRPISACRETANLRWKITNENGNSRYLLRTKDKSIRKLDKAVTGPILNFIFWQLKSEFCPIWNPI